MPDHPKKPDRLKPVLKITLGEEAQDRKKHNTRPQPGDVRLAQSAPVTDRLSRAIAKSNAADLRQREEEKEGKAKPGEQFMATDEGPSAEEIERIQVERFLRLARERFKLAAEAESAMRRDALDDLDFRVGNQWPKDVEMQRATDGRPCLTMNRLPAIIRQITNEQRQQRPSIQVNPVGSNSDPDTAEILQGMVRHIEVISDAEIAYDTAFESMVTQGFGDFRIVSEMTDEESNQQELKIKRIKNPFCVYWDPAASEPDYSDARYCFIIEDVPKEEYADKYKETQAATLSEFSSIGDNAPEWATRDTIRVAEYFRIEDEPITQTVQDEDGNPSEEPTGRTKPAVKWAKINAIEIIDERDVVGKYIPVIRVVGDDMDVNGKRHVAGIVRHAKDPQRMYNYWVTAATEMIALAPKAPFVIAEGQDEGHEREFEQANVRTLAVLRYKATSVDGHLVPPPERNQYEPPVQAIILMTKQADMDLKAVTGLFDPSLGAQQTADQSGKAIAALQKQGDVSTLNFADNLSRAIRHCGRVLLGMIPSIYDAPRVQRIINPDETVSHVVIHNQQADAAQGLVNDKVKRIYDIGVGTYDVTVSVGPSYQTKRQEAVAAQLALVQSYPNVFPVIGDMLVRNMDWPQAKEMADRLKKQLPPQLQDDNTDDPEQKLIAAQSQVQQLMQHNDVLMQQNQALHDAIRTKQVENQGKMDIEKLKIEAQVTIAEINAKAQEVQTRVKMEQDVWLNLHSSAHDRAMQADQQENELELQDNEPTPQPANGKAN